MLTLQGNFYLDSSSTGALPSFYILFCRSISPSVRKIVRYRSQFYHLYVARNRPRVVLLSIKSRIISQKTITVFSHLAITPVMRPWTCFRYKAIFLAF